MPGGQLCELERPSETPSINPTHAAATPIVARKAGIAVVAISCDQSLRSDASPMPSTVELSQRGRGGGVLEVLMVQCC
jgi:hypothetical protein